MFVSLDKSLPSMSCTQPFSNCGLAYFDFSVYDHYQLYCFQHWINWTWATSYARCEIQFFRHYNLKGLMAGARFGPHWARIVKWNSEFGGWYQSPHSRRPAGGRAKGGKYAYRHPNLIRSSKRTIRILRWIPSVYLPTDPHGWRRMLTACNIRLFVSDTSTHSD